MTMLSGLVHALCVALPLSLVTSIAHAEPLARAERTGGWSLGGGLARGFSWDEAIVPHYRSTAHSVFAHADYFSSSQPIAVTMDVSLGLYQWDRIRPRSLDVAIGIKGRPFERVELALAVGPGMHLVVDFSNRTLEALALAHVAVDVFDADRARVRLFVRGEHHRWTSGRAPFEETLDDRRLMLALGVRWR